MARPTKQGVDYFPIDVNFDDKIELFISENGSSGLGILIVLWQLIYQNEGYFVKSGDDLLLLIRRRIMSDTTEIKKAIDSAIARGIFSQYKHKKFNILTSSGIQKRYFIAARKKKVVMVDKNYICKGVTVSENSTYIGIDSAGNSTKEEVDVKVDVKEEVASRIIEHLNKKTNKSFKLVDSNISLIASRIKEGYVESDFFDAIDNQVAVWLGDEKMEVFLRPATLFGKQKFDGYVNNGKNGVKRTCDSCSMFCSPESPNKCNQRGNMGACDEYSKRTA